MPWYIAFLLLCVAVWMLRWKRSYLHGFDALLVSGDRYSRTVVHALLTTKAPISFTSFTAIVKKISDRAEFRDRIIERRWGWHYSVPDDVNFKLQNHMKVHRLECESLDPVVVQTALEAYVSTLLRTPMSLSRPAWEAILVEKVGVGSAIIFRTHHAIADGVTLVRLADSVFTKVSAEEAAAKKAVGEETVSSTSSNNGNKKDKNKKKQEPSVVFRAVDKFRKSPTAGPSNPVVFALAAVRSGISLLTQRSDPSGVLKPKTPITPEVGVNAKFLQKPLPLDELKQVAYATGTTVNDVLFSVMSGALRAYCLRRGEMSSTIRNLHTVTWVSLHGSEPPRAPGPLEASRGNNMGAMVLDLLLDEEDAVRRLTRVGAVTGAARASPEARVSAMLLKLVGLIPRNFLMPFWPSLAYRATSCMSNVVGPSTPVSIAQGGAIVDQMTFFAPPQGSIASFFSVLSYNGSVQVACTADARTIAEPREVLGLVNDEYEALKRALLQMQTSGRLQDELGLKEKQRFE